MKDNWILENYNFPNKVAIGKISDGHLSSIFSYDDLFSKAIEYVKRHIDEAESRNYFQQIQTHFLKEEFAVPISHFNGIVTFILRKDNVIYFASN